MGRRIAGGSWLAECGFASVKAEIGEHLKDEFEPRRRVGAKGVAVRTRLVYDSAGVIGEGDMVK
jgi:hypothetical protein